ncbi:hypothetical protein HKX48_002380 [Thoreauomyces humboldtii]|nr:hypothetical protein HKX48_002380 [Thoreauomyces humboldtii]
MGEKPDNVVCEDGVCHIDFSKGRKAKGEAAASSSTGPSPAVKSVDAAITDNKVFVFSKSYCPWCDKAKALLSSKGVAYWTVDLDTVEGGEQMHGYLKELNGQTTVPSIYVAGKHVGGYSDLNELEQSGELDGLLK